MEILSNNKNMIKFNNKVKNFSLKFPFKLLENQLLVYIIHLDNLKILNLDNQSLK